MLKQKLHIAYLNSLIFAQSCSAENRSAYKMYFACSKAGQKIGMCRILSFSWYAKNRMCKTNRKIFSIITIFTSLSPITTIPSSSHVSLFALISCSFLFVSSSMSLAGTNSLSLFLFSMRRFSSILTTRSSST